MISRAAFPGWTGSLWEAPLVVWATLLADIGLASSYLLIAVVLYLYATSRRRPPMPEIAMLFSFFILFAGVARLFSVVLLFHPLFWANAVIHWIALFFAALTAITWQRRYKGMLALHESGALMAHEVQQLLGDLVGRVSRIEEILRDRL